MCGGVSETLTSVIPIAQRGTDGLAPHTVLCISVQKPEAVKSKKSGLGSLGDQSEKLQVVLKTMKEKLIEVLVSSEGSGSY